MCVVCPVGSGGVCVCVFGECGEFELILAVSPVLLRPTPLQSWLK